MRSDDDGDDGCDGNGCDDDGRGGDDAGMGVIANIPPSPCSVDLGEVSTTPRSTLSEGPLRLGGDNDVEGDCSPSCLSSCNFFRAFSK